MQVPAGHARQVVLGQEATAAGCPPAASSDRSRRLWAAHVDVPSLTMAVQSAGLAQVTLKTTSAFCGEPTAAQVAPASLVVIDDAAPRQRCPVGADRHALGRRGAGHPAQLRGAAARDLLRLPGRAAVGGGGDHRGAGRGGGIGAGHAHGPAASCRGAGHALRARPCRSGAGWPTASGVPLASPRTRASLVEPGCPDSAQPDAVTATAARTRNRPPLRRRTRQCRNTGRGSTARRE